MLQRKGFKILELVVLFICIPIVLTLDFDIAYKLPLVLSGVVYCTWVSIRFKLISKGSLITLDFKKNLTRIMITFGLVSLTSFSFIYTLHPENLFIVVKKAPVLWATILLVYAVLSVYPQELLYRTFYFNRYANVFEKKYLILINIIIFPIAHLMFNNNLVLLVTLIGGILFTMSYIKHRSVLLTSIEHALYGNVLFTIGMGEMLAFPMPN